jgi:beta-galactosidase
LQLPETKAGSTSFLELPKEALEVHGHETWLRIDVTLKEDTIWAYKNHLVAWADTQLGTTTNSRQHAVVAMAKEIDVEDSKRYIVCTAGEFVLKFDKILGRIESWNNGKERIIEPGSNKLTFWRAPISNDASKDAPYWKQFGLDKLETSVRHVSVTCDQSAAKITVQSYIAPPILCWGFNVTVTYRFTGSQLHVSSNIKVTADRDYAAPDYIPRLGWEFAVPQVFDSARWFGLGPGESYIDKNNCARLGVYELATEAMDYKYDVPQENGNRSETRWAVVGKDRHGLSALVSQQNIPVNFGFKVSNASSEAVEVAGHPFQIERGNQYIRIDFAQHGVGSEACGPGVLPEHTLRLSQTTSFDVTLTYDEFL